MTESQVDRYSLDCKSTKFSLKVCLLNNEKILFELTNKNGPETYKTIVSLEELKDLCYVFYSYETINESLIIIKNTIESGTITLEEKNNGSKIELEFNINLDSVEYPPFIINLLLEENNDKNVNVQTVAPIFNYHGNKELEAKYGNIDYNTTEVNSIVESKVKPKAMEVEYIQPIIQFHYPDGSTKNTPLTPTLQGVGGKDLNMTEEEINDFKEMIKKDYNKRSVIRMEENSQESSNTPLDIEQNYTTKTMDNIRYNNIDQNLYEEKENIGNEEINQENVQKDNPEIILENNDAYLFQTPSPTLLVNSYNEARNYPTLTYRPRNPNLRINTIEPTVSAYIQPNIYQSNIYSTASILPGLYQRSIYNNASAQPSLYQGNLYNTASIQPSLYQSNIYNTSSSIQPSLYQSSLYNTASIQPNLYQRSLYNTASIQPNSYQGSLYNTASIQPSLYQGSLYNTASIQPNSYQGSLYNTASIPAYQNNYAIPIQSIYQPTQALSQSQINNMGSQNYALPYYQNQFAYQPVQFNYSQQSQLLPQPQINNMGSQYYMNSYYQGLNANLNSSWNYPRKLFYYSKL